MAKSDGVQGTGPIIQVPDTTRVHPAWIRLEDQLGWYDRKSVHCHSYFKVIKVAQIILAVAVPVLAHFPRGVAVWGTSLAGAGVAVLEGIQGTNQYASLWVTYRATAERLKHEKYLFLSAAGPYGGVDEAQRLKLLAERVEEHVSTEHANWFNETARAARARREPQT